MNPGPTCKRVIISTLLLGLPIVVPAADGGDPSMDTTAHASAIDVKKVFATNCSWCHDGYGTQAGKGPKLAGTAMSEEQIHDRIWNGKSGAMPAFKGVLSEEQTRALAAYIKGLPAN